MSAPVAVDPSAIDSAAALAASGRRFGFLSAVGVVVLSAGYFVPLVIGFATLPSPDVPFIDPWFSIMEILIILTAPLLVALMVAIHVWAPVRFKPFTMASVVFMGIAAGITAAVHFTVLTLSHRMEFETLPWLPSLLSFRWPSVPYALDILAWDVFFPLSALLVVPVFRGSRLTTSIRVLLLVSGVLALGGLAGVALNDMMVRNIGVVGYAVVFPVAAILLARLFRVRS
jgi:hypothetical protein